MKDLFTRIRPQVLIFGLVLGAISLYALRLGAVEVVGMTVGGLIAVSRRTVYAVGLIGLLL